MLVALAGDAAVCIVRLFFLLNVGSWLTAWSGVLLECTVCSGREGNGVTG
ncbi:hypothetical protein PR001_g8669 [Phytophthora rubi]|uniref:Uncharacterized protein n=1 Tax=Phytophthora rubi TaxID=129364 RepID=A0A6A3N8U0_9STRA|nr:hypothetical protein PR002_g12288 [Phytophthora rubi]KAE9036781.1 hypothetical protein PR001_g8669 [Phytophthora rubi]